MQEFYIEEWEFLRPIFEYMAWRSVSLKLFQLKGTTWLLEGSMPNFYLN